MFVSAVAPFYPAARSNLTTTLVAVLMLAGKLVPVIVKRVLPRTLMLVFGEIAV